MKTSSLLLTKSWPSLACTLALAVTTLLAPANTRSQAQVLITGFENSEGFTTGNVGGQQGWTGGTSSYLVVNNRSQSGSQSLRVVKGNSGRLDSPVLSEQGFTGASLWFSNPDTDNPSEGNGSPSFARFRILLSTDTETLVHLQFQFRYQNLTSLNYGLDYSGGSQYFSKSLLDPTAWTEFRFEADFNKKTYSVWIGETQLLSDIAINGNVTADSSIYRIQFWGHSGLQAGDAYYDHIQGIKAIPEPSSLALLGGGLLAGMVMLARRRKGTA